jgi:glycosyltransferase involved in cell wall biosynthesis
MKKLIIQIPCYNEEATLRIALSALPRNLPGIDKVEWLIIDDGSKDRTVEVARECGVDHVVSLPRNQGLARGFIAGLDACLKAGADIIVNTDADNQYCADDIPKLIAPILRGEAEIVVGARSIDEIEHFSPMKKALQKLGSWVVRIASKTDIPDAPSGFRAMSRKAAMQLNVFNEYTYTLETIIQAGQKNMAIVSVPIRTNDDLRPSRLVKSIPSYIRRSILTIVRIFMTYKPFRFFVVPGVVSFTLGFIIGLRFLYFYFSGHGTGHIQSVILAALLMGSGFFLGMTGLLADLISVNRKLLEKIDWRVREMEENIRDKEDHRGR